ncbi:MAG: hypothetical protein QF775_00070 [archaeon]|jgi:hypothetical protein|nr:hypothetical protein [archaeon]
MIDRLAGGIRSNPVICYGRLLYIDKYLKRCIVYTEQIQAKAEVLRGAEMSLGAFFVPYWMRMSKAIQLFIEDLRWSVVYGSPVDILFFCNTIHEVMKLPKANTLSLVLLPAEHREKIKEWRELGFTGRIIIFGPVTDRYDGGEAVTVVPGMEIEDIRSAVNTIYQELTS